MPTEANYYNVPLMLYRPLYSLCQVVHRSPTGLEISRACLDKRSKCEANNARLVSSGFKSGLGMDMAASPAPIYSYFNVIWSYVKNMVA